MDSLFLGLRVVVSLAAVLGLLWVIQRKVSKSGRGMQKAKHVTVVARQGIAGKASVAVVDVEGLRYVLGVTDQSVTVLSTGEAPQEARVTRIAPVTASESVASSAPVGPSAPVAPSFAEALAAAPAVELSPRRAARAAAEARPAAQAPLAGSILSAATWKQAAAAMRSQKRV